MPTLIYHGHRVTYPDGLEPHVTDDGLELRWAISISFSTRPRDPVPPDPPRDPPQQSREADPAEEPVEQPRDPEPEYEYYEPRDRKADYTFRSQLPPYGELCERVVGILRTGPHTSVALSKQVFTKLVLKKLPGVPRAIYTRMVRDGLILRNTREGGHAVYSLPHVPPES